MSPLGKVLGEIHRRSLWQILGVYLAAAWVVLQIVDILVDSLDLPRALPAFAILLILAGLPLVLATGFLQGGPPGAPDRIPSDGETAPPDADGNVPIPSTPPSPALQVFTWRNAITGGILAFALWGVIATVWIWMADPLDRRGAAEMAEMEVLDPNLVAVLPFRVTGPANIAFLAEGMVDLLAATLTGEGGLRATDPRTVMSAWRRADPGEHEEIRRDAAVDLGRSLGAGQVLLGGIVGTPSGLVLNASVFGATDGDLRAQATVEGHADSLMTLIDELTVQLLAQKTGERDQRLAALTGASLGALRAYLDGQAAYRRGSYSRAGDFYQSALSRDTTFALAALGWVGSSWWSAGFDEFNRALGVAWNLRKHLSPRDQALLDAWAGPRFPHSSGWAEHLPFWELAIALAPERPEPWYESGDIYFHYGSLLGVANSRRQAEARFRRAAELDSTFAAPLGHLLELAVMAGEEQEVRSFSNAYLALDSIGDTADFFRWRAASAVGDSASLTETYQKFAGMSAASLNRIIGTAQLYGPDLEGAERAASILAGRVGTQVERREWLLGLHSLALNRGHPGRADALLREWRDVEGSPGERLRIQVLDGLYWDGDQEAAGRAADSVALQVQAPLAPEGDLRNRQLADLCVAEQWRLSRGITTTAQRSLSRLRPPEADGGEATSLQHDVCAAIIEVLLRLTDDGHDGADAVDRLDALLMLVPDVETGDDPSLVGNFVVAKWRESRGDLGGALSAVRRWHNHWFTGARYLSTYLREEGRLAAFNGDREEAIQAYRHYLMLRADPAPELAPGVEEVRRELAVLLEETEAHEPPNG